MQPDSIVVAGGGARRIGGIDKVMLPLGRGGLPLLQQAIAACPGRVLVAGPRRAVVGDVVWVADESDDGGPAVGIWSALPQVATEYVFLTAGDQQVDPGDVSRVCAAAVGHDGAWAVRADGTGQPLFACVRTAVMRDLLESTRGVAASPLRLLATRDMVGVAVTGVRDVDTWSDAVALARQEGVAMTDMWLDHLARALGVDADVPVQDLLDLTRDIAHGVERKAAPLSTFLIGVAAAQEGRTVDEVLAAVRIALAEWTPDAAD